MNLHLLKYLRFTIRFFFLLIVMMLISSCKDNPVRPKIPIVISDTSDKYTWKQIYVGGELKELYVADSDHVFIDGSYAPLYYDGKSIQTLNLQDPNFLLTFLNGFDKNNIFFGGGTQSPSGNSVLKKWTNGNIESYKINDDTNSFITDILPVGQDQAWISGGNNKIYFFNSGIINQYRMDSNVLAGSFFKDKDNNLYVFGFKFISPNFMMFTYKFINDSLYLLNKDTLNSASGKSTILIRCGVDLLMIGNITLSDRLFLFSGQNWTQYMNTNFNISRLGGVSKDSLILLDANTLSIWVLDSNKWQKEDSANIHMIQAGPSNHGIILLKDRNAYFTLENQDFESYLIIGKSKKL